MKDSVCKKKVFVALLLISLIFSNIEILSARGNDSISNRNIQIEFRASYGFTICHHTEMLYFRAHYPVFELSVQQATFGTKYWHAKANYPAVGVSFLYTGLGEFKELGHIYAIYPYMSFNFLKSRRNQLNLKLGVGAGYATECFDPKNNYKNTFLGDNFNAIIHLSFEYNRFITNRLSLSAFVGLTHLSNGARRVPNNGINIAHAGLSTKYFINKPKDRIPAQQSDNQKYKSWERKNLSLYIAFTYALKDIDEYIGYKKNWSVYSLQINALKHISEMSKLGIGFDLDYDMTDEEILKLDDVSYNSAEILRPGVNIAYELAFGSTSFILNAGSHIYCKEDGAGYLYQKLCAKQNICKHLFLTCVLTTHFGWADFFTVGIGYKIN